MIDAPQDPSRSGLAGLAGSLGETGRVAAAASEDLLDCLVVLGERGTQDAVDRLVDEAAGVLREVAGAASELTLVLAGLPGGRGESAAAGRDAAAEVDSYRGVDRSGADGVHEAAATDAWAAYGDRRGPRR